MNAHTRRPLLYVKSLLAGLLGLATLLTLWRPTWIEALGLGDPDHGSGLVEVTILLVLAAATLLTTASAWREWTRTSSAPTI